MLTLTFCVFMLALLLVVDLSLVGTFRGEKADVATANGGTQGRRLRRAFHPCGHAGDGATKAAAQGADER